MRRIPPREGIAPLLDQHLPEPRSGRGLRASQDVTPRALTLYGGGDTSEDVRESRDDQTPRTALALGAIPSAAAIGDWLKRMGRTGGLQGMAQVNAAITRQVLTRDERTEHTLLVDPTIIEAEKRDAAMTCLGVKGYRPVVATLQDRGLVLACTFKAGNDTGGKAGIRRQAFQNMPRGKAITTVLLDAEYCTDDVMARLSAQGVRWAIAADKEAAGQQASSAIPEDAWRPLRTRDGILTDRAVAETVHRANRGQAAFRLIILRWRASQGDLFADTYRCHGIATNRLEETPKEGVWRCNERARIEHHSKELKGGFGMERLPRGDFAANAMHCAIGII